MTARTTKRDAQLELETEVTPAPRHVALVGDNAFAIPSPASDLQETLRDVFEHFEPVGRWSLRRTSLFLIMTSGLFWALLVFALLR